MDKLEHFFARWRSAKLPGEEDRVRAARDAIVRSAPLRSAGARRLSGDMNDPLSLFRGHARVDLAPQTKTAMLRSIVAEGRRRVAAADRAPAQPTGFFLTLRFAAGAFLVCVSTGTALAMAAESSVPGDALYAIKTDIVEPVIDTLQWTQKSKAAWAERRVERRVKESIVLLAERGDERWLEQAAMGIEQEVDRASRIAEAMERTGDVEATLDLHADVEASLDAHELARKRFRRAEQKDTAAGEIVVRKRQEVSETRKRAEQTFIEESSDAIAEEVQERAAQLEEHLRSIREELEETDDAWSEDISALASAAERTLEDIKRLPPEKRSSDALLLVESALRLTEEAQTLFEVFEAVEMDAEEGSDGE